MTDVLAAVAAAGLPGGAEDRWPVAPLDQARWQTLLARARAERIEGLLLAAIDSGALPAAGDQAMQAHAATIAAGGLAVRLERRAADAVAVLASASLGSRVLKGAAVALLDYPDPTWRHHGDVDVLVGTADFGAAQTALGSAGWTPPNRPTPPGWHGRFGKALDLRDAAGLEVDLHRTLADGAPGVWVVEADLWRAGDPVELDGRPALALYREARFVHACLHAALGAWPPRLSALRDVAQLGLHPDLDLLEVAALARRWRAVLAVRTAVEDAWERLRPLSAPPVLGLDGRRPLVERAALAAERDPARGYRRRALTTFGALPTVADRVAFVGAVSGATTLARRTRRTTAAWATRRRRQPPGGRVPDSDAP